MSLLLSWIIDESSVRPPFGVTCGGPHLPLYPAVFFGAQEPSEFCRSGPTRQMDLT